MNIVALLGSPRSTGNSAAIANRFTETAASLGARVTNFQLNRLTYRGCQGCYACKKGLDHCVLKDDLTQVLDAVAAADLVVLASPVYYGDMTAAMKAQDAARTSTLRMAKAALKNKEIDKRAPLDEAEALRIVQALVKQREDSVEQYVKGNRPELADKERAEIAVLKAYLPAEVADDEIHRFVALAQGLGGQAGFEGFIQRLERLLDHALGHAVDHALANTGQGAADRQAGRATAHIEAGAKTTPAVRASAETIAAQGLVVLDGAVLQR